MKTILALLALTLSAEARLGENIDQLIARYGTRPKVILIRGGELWTFTTPALTIVVQNGGFDRPVSIVERFTKRDDTAFTDWEVEEMTRQITLATTWRLPFPVIGEDGAKRWDVMPSRPKAKGFVLTLTADAKELKIEPMKEREKGL